MDALSDILLPLAMAALLILTAILIRPILWPTIITFPWKQMDKEDRIVVLAGSYNPPHLGHLAMLEYLSKR